MATTITNSQRVQRLLAELYQLTQSLPEAAAARGIEPQTVRQYGTLGVYGVVTVNTGTRVVLHPQGVWQPSGGEQL